MTLQHTGNKPPLPLCQGLLSSLQKLGHHHLLEVYLRGFAVQYPSHFLDLSEFQYAVCSSPLNSNPLAASHVARALSPRNESLP